MFIKFKNCFIPLLVCIIVLDIYSSVFAGRLGDGAVRLKDGIENYEHGKYNQAIYSLEMAKIALSYNDKSAIWQTQLYLGASYFLLGEDKAARAEINKAKDIFINKYPDPRIHSPKIVRLFKEELAISGISLRSSFKRGFGVDEAKAIMLKHNFFNAEWNKSGGAPGDLEVKVIKGDKVVLDHEEGLIWHQSGSSTTMRQQEALQWVDELNQRSYGGYKYWRLPSFEEAASLLQLQKKYGNLHIDPVFDQKQKYIWTTTNKGKLAWIVDFDNGNVSVKRKYESCYVRPVYSKQ
jgi:hypothetical protein